MAEQTSLIIYDFDMTLVDSKSVGRGILADTRKQLGLRLSIDEKQLWRGDFRDLISLIYQRALGRYPMEKIKEVVVKSAIQRYSQQELNDIETLLELQRQGIKQAVVSQNLRQIMHAFLQNPRNLMVNFDPVYSSDGTTKSARIEEIVREWEFPKREVIFVGDRPEDIAAGKYVGIRVAAITTGLHNKKELRRHKPDYLANTLTELKQIV